MADARRLTPNLAAGALLLVLVAAVLLWQRPWGSSPSDGVVPIPDDAGQLLTDQFDALSAAEDEQDFVAAAGRGPRAREFARGAWAARDALDVEDVELRHLRGGDVPDRADGSTVAEVAVSWRAAPDSVVAGTRVREATVAFRLDPQADGTFAVRSASALEEPVPLWLAGRIEVERAGDVRVVTVDGGVPDVDVVAVARTARRQVEEVVPRVDGALTVVAPRTRASTANLVGSPHREIAGIAAITTTVDGGTDTARVVVLNPAQFSTMDERAAQVVITHEATHQLTAAPGSDAERWVVEGFADFVALRDDDAPLAVSAGQALRSVREEGPPEALPTIDDFVRDGHRLGAVYELAWLVFRMLGERHDDAAVVGFYRDVMSGTSVEAALREAFDLDTARLTAQWRDYLTKRASTVS